MNHNSFTGLRQNVGNYSCRALIAEIQAFRAQLILKGEFDQASGWDDPLNQWMVEELGRIRETAAVTATSPMGAVDQAARNAQRKTDAADETQTLKDRYIAGDPITADDQMMPSAPMRPLPYDFSGADPKIPQMHGKKNYALVSVVNELDYACVLISKLDCQGSGYTIPPHQSSMIVSKLDSIYTICEIKGGTSHRRDIADGTNAVQDAAADVLPSTVTEPTKP